MKLKQLICLLLAAVLWKLNKPRNGLRQSRRSDGSNGGNKAD